MQTSESGSGAGARLAPLSAAALVSRFALLAFVVLSLAGAFAYAAGFFTPHALTGARIVDTFEAVNGVQPGFRRNHAKGVGFSGAFQSSGRGAAWSKASVF